MTLASIKRYVLPLLIGFLLSLVIIAAPDKYQVLLTSVEAKYGARAVKRVKTWRDIVAQNQNASELEKLTRVNDFFNQMEFVDDIIHWGKEDYWATPVEFLGTMGGDCEDFTIAKYFTLRELGISDEKLRLVYVKSLSLNQHHMVLAFYNKPTSVPVLLDNIDKQLKPASKRKDLLPIYSFNAKNLWLSKAKGRGELVGGSSRLSLWTDLNDRLEDFK